MEKYEHVVEDENGNELNVIGEVFPLAEKMSDEEINNDIETLGNEIRDEKTSEQDRLRLQERVNELEEELGRRESIAA